MTAIPSGWTPEQARQRLDATSSSDGWLMIEDGEIVCVCSDDGDREIIPWNEGATQVRREDAIFIANAPTDVAALLALLDDARSLIAKTIYNPPGWAGPNVWWKQEADSFLARFAADKDNP